MYGPTLRQLEYLVAVADHGQFKDAALACSVSQPALSKQVRAAEELLGVQVFERARPRVLVTAVGARIIAKAREVLRAARGVGEIAAAHKEPGGQVVLGVIPTVAPYVFPPAIDSLGEAFPRLDIILREGETETLVAEAQAGELDLVMMAFPVEHGGLEGIDLFTEPFLLAAPEGHALAARRAASVDELVGHELLLMSEGHCFRDHALQFCGALDARESNRVRATSMTTMCLMTQNGVGATLVPATAVDAEFRGAGKVVVRAFEESAPGRRIGLRWRATHPWSQLFEEMGGVIRRAVLAKPLFEEVEVFGRPHAVVGV